MTAPWPGLEVHVSPLLPSEPSPGEDARRYVRHAYASLRSQTGEAMYFPDAAGAVGLRPGEPIQALQTGDRLLVSQELWDRLATKVRDGEWSLGPFSIGSR
jgi:hypothetical protein